MNNQGQGAAGGNAQQQQGVPIQTCRLPTPKNLELTETRESLTTWLDVLHNYLLRDANSQRFVTGQLNWNPAAVNYGLQAEGPGSKLRRTAPEMEAALREMFRTISSFFPFGFLKRKFPQSTSFQNIKEMIYQAYNLQLNSCSLLEHAGLKRTPDENHFIFYSRVHDYFYEHLAPANATGGGYTAPPGGDTMSLSHANLIALIWLEKTDRRLLKLIKQEYGAELRGDTQLVELVPRIASDMDNLLQKLEDVKINRVGNSKTFGYGRNKDNADRGSKKSSGNRSRSQLHCPRCKFLSKEIGVDIPNNHNPTDCPRKNVQVRQLKSEDTESENYETGDESDDQDQDDGELAHSDSSPVLKSTFQASSSLPTERNHLEISPEPPPVKTLSSSPVLSEVPAASISHDRGLSDAAALRALQQSSAKLLDSIRQVSPTSSRSATLLSDYKGEYFVSVVDGGAEINCLDLDLTRRLKIPFLETDVSAKTPGSNEVALAGVSTSDVIISADFSGRAVPVDMQRTAIIRNLGAAALIGEPAKRRNKLDVISHEESITIRYGGEKFHTHYYLPARRNYRLARVSRSEVVEPGGFWSASVPRGLSGEVFLVVPTRGGPDWFAPGFYKANDGKIEIRNTSGLPVALSRKRNICEVRTCGEDNLRDLRRRRKKVLAISRSKEKVQGFISDEEKKGENSSAKKKTSQERFQPEAGSSSSKTQRKKISISGTKAEKVDSVPGETKEREDPPAIEVSKAKSGKQSGQAENISRVVDTPSDGFRYKNFRKPEVCPPVPEPEVIMDPDGVMPDEAKKMIRDITNEYSEVFTRRPGKYNGKYGKVDNSLNFSSIPAPNLKVYQPNYSDSLRKEMGDLMDRLMDFGVLQTPESVGVTPEFLSPSLIVPKNEEGEFRLVTDFSNLNKYIRKYPSTSPSFEDTKNLLARKKYFIHLDLSNFFFQAGLENKDCQYLCTYHPYRGVVCYVCAPQGLRNSSEQGYEILNRVFGTLTRQDKLGRLMDSLIPVGNNWQELAASYRETLHLAREAGLTFKPAKVTVCPQKMVLFGWQLSGSTWTPTSHTTSALAKCEVPKTVKGLRSFLGSFKQFSECVKNYAAILHGLEQLVGGRASAERIEWTETNLKLFQRAKEAALDISGIQVPRPSDTLHTFSDYSHDSKAVGGRLEIIRTENGKKVSLHGGYYCVVLDKFKQNWAPCEAEACGVRLVLEHFAPYIRESENTTIHHTDNLPTVQAWKRCMQGQFSSSSRISTFLTNLSELPVSLVYKPGAQMHSSDFFSRHPVECDGPASCQICKFATEWQKKGDNASKIRAISVKDILDGRVIMPFIQTKTWIGQQIADKVHTKLKLLVETGQQPEKRKTRGDNTVIKKMYKCYQTGDLTIRRDGLVVMKSKNGHFDGNAISVPHHLMSGLAFTLHVKLGHPSKGQLQALMSRYFWCPGHSQIIQMVTENCVQCRSVAQLPKEFQQDVTEATEEFGTRFAADVMERNTQRLFVIREKLSQLTWLTLIPDQTKSSLREALVRTILPWTNPAGATIRCDGATGFVSLATEMDMDTSVFKQYKISLEVGRVTNINKNPVAENAVRETEKEINKYKPHVNQVTEEDLAVVSRIMNDRIRDRGVAAREIFLRRDVTTFQPKDIQDKELSDLQFKNRMEANTRQQEKRRASEEKNNYHVGDVVYIKSQISKHQPRQKHIITGFKEDKVILQKFENKFGSKQYEVLISEIIPINTNSEDIFDEVKVIEEKQESDNETKPDSEEDDFDIDLPEPAKKVTKKRKERKKATRKESPEPARETRPQRRSAGEARLRWKDQYAVSRFTEEDKKRQKKIFKPGGYIQDDDDPVIYVPSVPQLGVPDPQYGDIHQENFMFIDPPGSPERPEPEPQHQAQLEPVLQPAEVDIEVEQLMQAAAAAAAEEQPVNPGTPAGSVSSDQEEEQDQEEAFDTPPESDPPELISPARRLRVKEFARDRSGERKVPDSRVAARHPESIDQIVTSKDLLSSVASRVVNLDQLEEYPDLDNISASPRKSGRQRKAPEHHKDYRKH